MLPKFRPLPSAVSPNLLPFAGPDTVYRLRRLSLTIFLPMSTFFACFSVITTTSGEGLETLAFFLLVGRKEEQKPNIEIRRQERQSGEIWLSA